MLHLASLSFLSVHIGCLSLLCRADVIQLAEADTIVEGWTPPPAHGRHRRRVRELFVEQSPLRLSEIGQMVSEATATYKVSVAEVRLAVGFDDDRS